MAGGRPLVSAATDPYWSSVVALLHFDGTNGSTTIVDRKGHAFSTVGAAALSTTEKKYGVSSLLLDGTSSFLSAETSADWEFGSVDFTVEGWIRPAATIAIRQEIIGRFNTRGFGMQVTDSGFLRAFCANSTSGIVIVGPGATTVSAGAWHHVALCRSGSTLRLFLDGSLQASASISGAIDPVSAQLVLGVDPSVKNTRFFNGSFDEFRITKGYARYTVPFTPSDAAFPDS